MKLAFGRESLEGTDGSLVTPISSWSGTVPVPRHPGRRADIEVNGWNARKVTKPEGPIGRFTVQRPIVARLFVG